MKGLAWIILSVLGITILASLSIHLGRPGEWCTGDLQAGDCEKYSVDKTCYCIDEENQNVTNGHPGVYRAAQTNCQKLNGTLATPEQDDLLRWLAKRMYDKGIDNAVVGLQRLESKWFWMKGSERVITDNLTWRNEFPINPQHIYTTINVATIKIDENDDGNIDYYHNYDHYYERDPTYLWYGLKTYDDVYNYMLPVFHICNYVEKPEIEMKETNVVLTTASATIEETQDDCDCSANEEIELKELLDSQTFTSSNYPSNYCSDQSCRWFVKAPEGMAVKLEWVVFDTENQMDWVFIYDGYSTKDTMLSSCSGPRCSDQVSSGNLMQVHFNADHVITDLGFKGRVTAVETDPCYCSSSASIYLANLDDGFVISSPNYPHSYCTNHQCSWTISVPSGLGLRLTWNKFETEPDRDYLYIYYSSTVEEAKLLKECTGESCGELVSPTEQIRIDFISDAHVSEHTGFSILVTVVQNYCDLSEFTVPLGTLTLSEKREDDFVPAGATVTVNCPPNSTIVTTESSLKLNATAKCSGPHWETQLPICESLCEFKVQSGDSMSDVCQCSYERIYNGLTNRVTVEHYDYIQKRENLKTEHICANNSVWYPEPPICHIGGILFVGGSATDDYMEFYSPIDKISRAVRILKQGHMSHTAQVLTDGRLMMIGGRDNENDNQEGLRVETIDLSWKHSENSSVILSNLTLARQFDARSAVLNGSIYVCFGDYWDDTCEVLENGQFRPLEAKFQEPRMHAALVALSDSLYIIGGDARDYNIWELASVEKYSLLEPTWKFVAPMDQIREYPAAAELYGFIYVCGGEFRKNGIVYEQSSCEKYNPEEDIWQYVADMNEKRTNLYLVPFFGRLYAIGGYIDYDYIWSMTIFKLVEEYNPVTDHWEKQGELLETRVAAGAVTLPFVPQLDD